MGNPTLLKRLSFVIRPYVLMTKHSWDSTIGQKYPRAFQILVVHAMLECLIYMLAYIVAVLKCSLVSALTVTSKT